MTHATSLARLFDELGARPGDIVYLRSRRAKRVPGATDIKISTLQFGDRCLLIGVIDPYGAELDASFVVDASGRVLKDRYGSAPEWVEPIEDLG